MLAALGDTARHTARAPVPELPHGLVEPSQSDQYPQCMKFSAHFGVRRTHSDDWFDPDLSVDTRLFLDPFLLLDEKANPKSLWASAHDKLIGHFARCYDLLARAGSSGTMSEQIARGLLSFPEPAELCLGYTASGTSGSGSGTRHAKLIVGSIVTAIAAGLNRPEHIEEIGILNEGIGADRISDAACNVLKPIIIEYTKKVTSRHGIPTSALRVRHSRCDLKTGRWIDERHELPENPVTGKPVLLIPQRLLNHLPVLNAHDWFDSTFNADLRREMNVQVGERVPKQAITRAARRHPDRIREWANDLRSSGQVRGYDFATDPLGVVSWQDAGKAFADHNPLSVSISGSDDLRRFVETLLDLYRLFIEEQGGWKLLWNDNGDEKPEEAAQLALLGMARPYCRAHGVEIDREVNLGRGPVDFKVTKGASVRLLVEAKKLHNGEFWNGLERQLPSYMKSDQTSEGWLLAIRYRSAGVSTSRSRELTRRVERINEISGTSIGVTIIDARPKPSASKIGRSGTS